MRSSCKQASGCRERKRTPSSRCSNSTTLKLQPAALPSPRPSCSPAPGCSRTPREAPAAAPRLGASAALEGKTRPVVARSSSLSRDLVRISGPRTHVFRGTTAPSTVGRGLTAAARLPLSPPSLASVAAGDGLASARQASCCCAALRPRHSRPHAGTPPSTRALLSAARPDGTHRAARVAGGVTASTAGVGHSKVLPSGDHRGTIVFLQCRPHERWVTGHACGSTTPTRR